GAIRDRYPADHARAQDWQGESHPRLAPVAARRGRARGPARRVARARRDAARLALPRRQHAGSQGTAPRRAAGGGNGTTYAAIAPDVISGAIVGRLDVDADLYRFPEA